MSKNQIQTIMLIVIMLLCVGLTVAGTIAICIGNAKC